MKFDSSSAASWHELSRKWDFPHVKDKLLTQTAVAKGLECCHGRKSSGSTVQGSASRVLWDLRLQLCESLYLGFTNLMSPKVS